MRYIKTYQEYRKLLEAVAAPVVSTPQNYNTPDINTLSLKLTYGNGLITSCSLGGKTLDTSKLSVTFNRLLFSNISSELDTYLQSIDGDLKKFKEYIKAAGMEANGATYKEPFYISDNGVIYATYVVLSNGKTLVDVVKDSSKEIAKNVKFDVGVAEFKIADLIKRTATTRGNLRTISITVKEKEDSTLANMLSYNFINMNGYIKATSPTTNLAAPTTDSNTTELTDSFEFDKSILKPGVDKLIDSAIKPYDKTKPVKIEISASNDSKNDLAGDGKLVIDRSNTVINYIKSKGFSVFSVKIGDGIFNPTPTLDKGPYLSANTKMRILKISQ